MAKMKAAKLFGPRDTRVVEVDRPTPGPGEILVRVKAVAICPSDLRLWEDGHAGGTYPDHPFTQGHEFSGIIEELGANVDGPSPGTRVAVTPLWPCGHCDLCREGLDNICRNIVFPSFPQADGAMAEFMVVPSWAVEPLPENVDFVQAALVEPLQAALHGVEIADLRQGGPVAVVGAGIIGLSVLQVLRARGIEDILVAEPAKENRALAERLGARKTAPYAADLLAQLPSLDQQPRVVFECSGHPAAFAQAMELCRPAGQVVIIGVPHPDIIEFDTRPPRRKELRFVFSRRYNKRDLPAAVELLREGKVDLGTYPVMTFSLDDAAEAMRIAATRPPGVLRVAVAL
ncbi:MAG: alcohol dehydrogenase catalytic domain-containing protein [Armatimonadetes bacterium]|nr:alcohol dehydrogenase catalytic domain-containing protein [Armatimonadota bacterium]